MLRLLISFFCLLFSSALCSQSGDIDKFEDWYHDYRELYKEIFTFNSSLNSGGELIDNGIGEWIDSENRFEKWGEGLSALRISFSSGSSRLKYGGDSGLNLGKKFAMLAMEYKIKTDKGDFNGAQKTLNELYLALQAYRRLDMTANHMIYKYYQKCRQNPCSPVLGEGGIRFDGYSGFFIRDDIWFNLDSKRVSKEASHLKPQFADGKLLDVFRKLNDEKGCQEKDGAFICCFDKLVDYNLFNSQDQIVGLMHGLAFIKRFVPSEAAVELNGESILIHNLTFNIANALWTKTKSCGRSLKIPNCDADCGSKSHGTGSNTKAFQKGLNEVYNFITDNREYPSFIDHYIFGVSLPISTFGKFFANSIFNTRLFTKLQVAGNVKCNCKMLKDAYNIQYYTAGFEYSLLYNDTTLLQEPCFNDHKSIVYLSLEQIIHSMSILNGKLPCHIHQNDKGQVDFICELDDNPYAWCTGGPLESNKSDCSNAQSSISSPIDFLYMYNILKLTDTSIIE